MIPQFQQYGESGAWVSEIFPHVARRVDDLCIINGMHGSNSRHGGALLECAAPTAMRPRRRGAAVGDGAQHTLAMCFDFATVRDPLLERRFVQAEGLKYDKSEPFRICAR